MQLPLILAIARAEIRSVRRLTRYWTFVVLSVGGTCLIYGYHVSIHSVVSRFSATVGSTAPRYLVPVLSMYFLAIFLLGLIFLAFDIRARDERDSMVEVLDARPFSNIELLVGRSLALVLMVWVPLLVVIVALETFGILALTFGWYLGEPLEPYSLVGFTLDALSVLTAWCAVVVALTVLVRNRLVVVMVALGLLSLQVWSIARLPIYLQPVFWVLGGIDAASDLVPTLGSGTAFTRRAILLILAAGLLAVAAAWHPRLDGGSKSRRIVLGTGLLAAVGLLVGILVWQAEAGIDRRTAWLVAHQDRRDDPRADVQAVVGTVHIDPGRRLGLDLAIRVQAPPDRRLNTLLFTFNPGLSVTHVAVSGAMVTWTHVSGLLEITPSRVLPPGATTTIELKAAGRPDLAFGYLDSELDPNIATLMNAQIALLGTEHGIFSTHYVALMPGISWLPHAGSDVPTGDPRTHPADYFEADLKIMVPAGWLVAGPGRRQTLNSTLDGEHFRFRPGAPVPHVGLLASRFARRAIDAAGIEVEILAHPAHQRNLLFFEDAANAIQTRAEEIFTNATTLGLPYPYGGLTLVESPLTLRGYGGGWRMDTTQTLPGVLLLRENGFTASRFEVEFRDPARFETRDGGIAGAKVEALERFFENDVSGGNLFLGGSRNFLLFQTGAYGEGALAIDFVIDALVSRLLTDKQGYFSAFLSNQQPNAIADDVIAHVTSGRVDSIVEAVLGADADRPVVWDHALSTSLADLDPSQNARQTLNVLALKGHAIARAILDGLGREKTGALLAALCAKYRGGHFRATDLTQIAKDLGADLDSLIGDWLHEVMLPGFVTSPVVVERLADDDRGIPRYQTRVHVRNDEATPGLVRLRYATADRWNKTMPVRVAGHQAVEIGVLSTMSLQELWLQPYLSLNRRDVLLAVPRVEQKVQASTVPFLGARSSLWRPTQTADIVVDDLDAGFSVESDTESQGTRLGEQWIRTPVNLDQGLPEARAMGTNTEWSRRDMASSWGKYRHTIAQAKSGVGHQRAIFAADLPHAGRWQLAYHLPQLGTLAMDLGAQIDASVEPAGIVGTYDMTLIAGGESRSLEFDGAAAKAGWNVIGEFDLPQGEVRIVVSDASSGRLVIADAIRWQSGSVGMAP